MVRKARGFREVIRDTSRHSYKHTSIGHSKNTRVRNKHKKLNKKVYPNGKPMYRGQGKWQINLTRK